MFQLPSTVLTVLAYALGFLLLLNVRSFPLIFHFRMLRPAISLHIQHRFLRLLYVFNRRKQEQVEDRFFNSLSPVGAHPLKCTVVYTGWAGLDDIDYNGHLSNSSYAKILDLARFKCALTIFPHFFRAGGWCALGGTHYSFIREIPAFSRYEIRTTIGAWDRKWLYIVSKFVTKPPKKARNQVKSRDITANTSSASEDSDTGSDADNKPVAPSFSITPLSAASELTPEQSLITDHPLTSESIVKTTLSQTRPATSRGSPKFEAEPDGAILNTIAISRVCYKVGRMTVPPGLVLAINGLSGPPPPHDYEKGEAVAFDAPSEYSAMEPPPHWEAVQRLISKPNGGSMRKLKEFLKDGWRNVPEGHGRWWEVAMGGEVEEIRERNLRVLEMMSKGMEGLRSM